VDFLLKGPEYKLGRGTVLVDSDGHERKRVRAKWWIPIRPGMTHAEGRNAELARFMKGGVLGFALLDNLSERPVFFGHYWLKQEPTRNPSIQMWRAWTGAAKGEPNRLSIRWRIERAQTNLWRSIKAASTAVDDWQMLSPASLGFIDRLTYAAVNLKRPSRCPAVPFRPAARRAASEAQPYLDTCEFHPVFGVANWPVGKGHPLVRRNLPPIAFREF
jgi:hypothetical protein